MDSSNFPRYSLSCVGPVKKPVHVLPAAFGSGINFDVLRIFEAVGSSRPAGMQFGVGVWQLGDALVPTTCVFVPGVFTLKESAVKSPMRSFAVGTTAPVSCCPTTCRNAA